MLRLAHDALLRMPHFKGRARLDALVRKGLRPPLQNVDGVWMELDPQEWIQIELISGRPQEPKTARMVRRLLKAGQTMVDIGAHVGWLSLIAARAVGPTGRVVAVDPQPYNCNKVLINAAANGFNHILTVCAAAADVSGSLTLSNQTATDKARLTLAGDGVNDNGQRFIVPTFSVPDLMAATDIDHIHLLKVDVEGYELPVFRGAESVLNRVDAIIFEALQEEDVSSRDAIVRLLQSHGFSLFTMDGEAAIGPAQVPENNILATRHTLQA